MSFSACRGDANSKAGPDIARPSPAGEFRSVRLGFSSLAPDSSGESYLRAFAIAAQYGDIILIQRTPPWEEFLTGGKISKQTAQTTRLEVSLLDQYSHLQRFYAIDPTDGAVQRNRIANLPDAVNPTLGFADPAIRRAFLNYTSYVVSNYHPDYLALGVEINMFADRTQGQFESFISLYKEAYTLAKGLRPGMKVFPTFQLEDLEGNLGAIHPPHWELLDQFRGYMDVLAISSYPYLADLGSAGELRADYFSQLKTRFPGDIMIAETAYPSAPAEGARTLGTEEDQAIYLIRLLDDANKNGFLAVVWLAALNPAAAGGSGSVLRDTGLRNADGANKIAWGYWEDWIRRPLAPGR